MKVVLNFEQENEIKRVNIRVGKYSLLISKDSQKWNQDGINEFLINIASSLPEGEKFEIEFDSNNNDEMYKYIYTLFDDFCNEYNKLIDQESN